MKPLWFLDSDSAAVRLYEGKPCLVKTGPKRVWRYTLGRWEIGHGWQDFHNRIIYDPVKFMPLELLDDD